MQFSTPFALLLMTLMSGTDARIGGGRRYLQYVPVQQCNPNRNPTYAPECKTGFICQVVALGSNDGTCVVNPPTPQPTPSPTLAPTPADITEDDCAALSTKATGYSWCKLTSTCLPPGDDACKKADCEQNSGSTGYSWCIFNRSCIAPSATCDAQTCDTDSDCPPTTTCKTMYGGKARCSIGDGRRDLQYLPNPTLAPTPADITEDDCAALGTKATGYSWCKLTSTCLAPGDDACKKAECEQNSGSTGYSWCVFSRSCIAPSATCDAQTCDTDSDCPPTTTCKTMYGGKARCGQ